MKLRIANTFHLQKNAIRLSKLNLITVKIPFSLIGLISLNLKKSRNFDKDLVERVQVCLLEILRVIRAVYNSM